ncbi:hypothetical protein EDE09_1309 [Neorhizobium sp. S3-V5DH]|nr:hypothetical protein EDE09_1309 [Neorhizobium sp. S3-V5DH]
MEPRCGVAFRNLDRFPQALWFHARVRRFAADYDVLDDKIEVSEVLDPAVQRARVSQMWLVPKFSRGRS